MELLNFHLYDKSAAQLVVSGPCHLVELDGNYAGSGNEYLQIFDKATAPVANDVPIMSFALTAAGPLPSIFAVIGTLYFVNGFGVGISTTNEKYTASASAFDVFGATELTDIPALTGTTAVTQGTATDIYTVFNEAGAGAPEGPKNLVSAVAVNGEGATRYVFLYADATLATTEGSKPILQWKMLTGTTLKLWFGVTGTNFFSLDSSHVLHVGCFFVVSTTPTVLTTSSDSGFTFDASYL